MARRLRNMDTCKEEGCYDNAEPCTHAPRFLPANRRLNDTAIEEFFRYACQHGEMHERKTVMRKLVCQVADGDFHIVDRQREDGGKNSKKKAHEGRPGQGGFAEKRFFFGFGRNRYLFIRCQGGFLVHPEDEEQGGHEEAKKHAEVGKGVRDKRRKMAGTAGES